MWNQDSLWYRVRVVQPTLQALFRSTITGVMVQGFRALLYLLLTRVIWSSHADLRVWFGSSLVNRSVFNTLSRHYPLVAVSRSTSIITFRLGSSASLSSPFQVPVTLVPTVQSFCPATSLCLLSNSGYHGYMNQHAMWKYCIAHKWGRMYIRNTQVIYLYTYIYKYTRGM